MDNHSFCSGKSFDAYEFFGCHLEGDGAVFRVYAPSAVNVSLIGEFNDWQDTPMNRIADGNFWAVFVAGVKPGQMYKYKIYKADGNVTDHCDPYGYGSELRPASASIVRDMGKYTFDDAEWVKKRGCLKDKPLNIYEVHAGSWKKKNNEWYRYDELAGELVPYLKDYGYNYVEFLPLAEHPNDDSWGYQPTGFFCPTARYGSADDFKKMIDIFHENGIGVLLDFVVAGFATDYYGLEYFDGTPLYGKEGEFDIQNGAVRSFLQSSAHFWIKEYHVDGFRMGTLSNLMQRDKEAATEFFRYMNDSLKTMHKGIILVAEDLTAYSNVTKPVSEGGLGFDYKWDKCWCQDTLQYFQTNPRDRERIKDSISIDLEYLQNEQAVLAVSHDDVVYGRAAVIQKMYGDYEQKFAQARAFYAYMMIHPGKKLLFMGGEIAHFREWDVKREQDWNLLDFPKHRQFAEYIKKLNAFYMETEMLYDNKAAAEQLDCKADKASVYVFERRLGEESCIAVFNLQETASGAAFALEMDKKLVPVINTDAAEFGGSGAKQTAVYSNSGKAVIKMPGFSAVIYLVKECGEDERQAFEQENQPVENVKAPEQENVSVENAVSKEADVSVTGIVADDKEQTVKLVDGPWYDRAVVYHIYTLGYCGAPDYNEGEKTKGSRILCVLDQIPHLKELGINTIYFGPIFESGWHGYDTNDYYMTDSRLGTIEDFKTVFKELKNNGIRIVLDGVFNHVGRGFGPFIDLQKNREQSKYRDWFCNINFGGRSGGGDSFSYDTWQGNWELVKLNMRNPAVVEHLLNAVKMWIDEFDIDGLRLDAADCIDKEFFKRLKTFTEGQKKDFWLMGEIIHGDYKMWANPDMMHSVTNYECWKGIYSSHNDKNYFEIAHSLRRQFERGGIYENLRLYNFLDNHDVNRIASLLKDKRDLSNAYTLMFTMPGISSIYYGSEWAVSGVKTKGREADKPVRQPIAQILEGELDQRPAECIKELTRFRRNSNALIYGNYENVMIKNMQLVIARNYENETVIAAFNIADNAEHFSFDYRGRKYEFTLEPHSNVVYQNI